MAWVEQSEVRRSPHGKRGVSRTPGTAASKGCLLWPLSYTLPGANLMSKRMVVKQKRYWIKRSHSMAVGEDWGNGSLMMVTVGLSCRRGTADDDSGLHLAGESGVPQLSGRKGNAMYVTSAMGDGSGAGTQPDRSSNQTRWRRMQQPL